MLVKPTVSQLLKKLKIDIDLLLLHQKEQDRFLLAHNL